MSRQTEQIVAMVAAGIGVIATIFWAGLGLKGIKLLQDIRDATRKGDRSGH